MPYEIGLGEAIAQGLAQGVSSYTGLQQQGFQNQTQLQQQNIQNLQQQQAREAQQKQQELQNAQQEQTRLDQLKQRGEDVTYRNDEASKARDKTLYDHLKGSEDKILAALPTLDKQSLEYGKANSALSLARKLMGKIITPGRTQFTPEELASFDQLNADLAPVLGRAAEVVGGLELRGKKADVTGREQGVAKGAVELQYLEPTYQAQLRQAGIVSETGEFNLQNLQAMAPGQLESLRLDNAGKIQALETAKNLSPLQIEGARKNLNLISQQIREATRLNDVGDDLQVFDTAGKRSDYLSRMAKSGDKEGLQRLADKGLLSAPELEQFGVQAKQAQRQGEATTVIQEGTATGVDLENTLKGGQIKLAGATYNYTVRTAAAGADNAATAASQAAASLKLFEAKAPSEVKIIEGQAALIAEELDLTGKVNPLKLKLLKEQVYDAARKNKVGDAFDEKQAQAAYDGVLAGIGLTKAQTTGVDKDTVLKDGRIKLEGATYNYTVRTAAAGADSAETAASQAAASLDLFKKVAPYEVGKAETILDDMRDALANNRELRPQQVKQLREVVTEMVRKNAIGGKFDEATVEAQLGNLLAGIGLTKAQTKGVDVNTAQGERQLDLFNSVYTYKINQEKNNAEGGAIGVQRAQAELDQFEKLAPKEVARAQLLVEQLDDDIKNNRQIRPEQYKMLKEAVTEAVRKNTVGGKYDDAMGQAALDNVLSGIGLNKAQTKSVETNTALNQKQLDVVNATFDSTVSAMNSKNTLEGARAEISRGLLKLEGAALQSEFLDKIASTGNFGRQVVADLVKEGALSENTLAAMNKRANQVEAGKKAAANESTARAQIITLTAAVKDETFKAEVAGIIANKDTALVELDIKRKALKQMDPEFTKKQALLTAQIESIKQGTLEGKRLIDGKVALQDAQTANTNANTAETLTLTPGKAALQTAQTASINQGTDENIALLQGKLEGQAAQNANTRAGTANTQANTTGTLLDNWVKSKISGDKVELSKISVVDAKTTADSNLLNLKFIDATFADKVKDVALATEGSTVKLNQLKREYLRDPKKFALEIKEIEGRIRYNDAQTDALIAREAPANGVGGTAKLRAAALEGGRKATAIEVSNARAGYKTMVDIYFANAKISVDKYDPKNYATLVSNAQLTPEQTAQLASAKNAYEEATERNSAIARISLARAAGKEGSAKDWAAFGVDITAPKPVRADVPYFVGSGKSPASGLPTTEIEKQIAMSTELMSKKVTIAGQSFKVKGSDTFNDKGWVRAYNGYGRNADGSWMNPDYVGGVQASAQEKPWVSAISNATGARKTELETINSLSEQYAKKYKIDPDTVKAIFWNESYGWQPGVNSSDGKGGGLGQFTGYFVKGPGAITWQEAQRRSGGNPSSAAPAAAPNSTAAPAAPPSSGVKGVAQIGQNQIGSSYLDEAGIQKAMGFISRAKSPPGDFKGQPARDKEFSLYKQAAQSAGVKPADAEKAAEELVSGLGYKVYKVGDYRITDTDVKFLLEYKNKAQGFKTPPNLSLARQQDYKREQIAKALGTLTKTLRRNGFAGNVDGLLAASVDPAFKGLFQ